MRGIFDSILYKCARRLNKFYFDNLFELSRLNEIMNIQDENSSHELNISVNHADRPNAVASVTKSKFKKKCIFASNFFASEKGKVLVLSRWTPMKYLLHLSNYWKSIQRSKKLAFWF